MNLIERINKINKETLIAANRGVLFTDRKQALADYNRSRAAVARSKHE